MPVLAMQPADALPPSSRCDDAPAGKALPLGAGEAEDSPLYKTDNFRMWCFKVLPCSKRYVHDWTICPFAHPGEKAKRRDPRVFSYTGVACPDMKKCQRGDACPYAHNVFEYWMHPSRYRTQLCNDGIGCKRKVCFFAHTLDELRVSTVKLSPDAASDGAFELDPFRERPSKSPKPTGVPAAATSPANEALVEALRAQQQQQQQAAKKVAALQRNASRGLAAELQQMQALQQFQTALSSPSVLNGLVAQQQAQAAAAAQQPDTLLAGMLAQLRGQQHQVPLGMGAPGGSHNLMDIVNMAVQQVLANNAAQQAAQQAATAMLLQQAAAQQQQQQQQQAVAQQQQAAMLVEQLLAANLMQQQQHMGGGQHSPAAIQAALQAIMQQQQQQHAQAQAQAQAAQQHHHHMLQQAHSIGHSSPFAPSGPVGPMPPLPQQLSPTADPAHMGMAGLPHPPPSAHAHMPPLPGTHHHIPMPQPGPGRTSSNGLGLGPAPGSVTLASSVGSMGSSGAGPVLAAEVVPLPGPGSPRGSLHAPSPALSTGSPPGDAPLAGTLTGMPPTGPMSVGQAASYYSQEASRSSFESYRSSEVDVGSMLQHMQPHSLAADGGPGGAGSIWGAHRFPSGSLPPGTGEDVAAAMMQQQQQQRPVGHMGPGGSIGGSPLPPVPQLRPEGHGMASGIPDMLADRMAMMAIASGHHGATPAFGM